MEWQYRLDEIGDVALRLLDSIRDQTVIVFEGQLGAGKTTLISALCRCLNVRDTVSSPTFSIINEYACPPGVVYHIDLYRCQSEEEAVRAGVEECLYSGRLCLVEWPSKAPGIFPPQVSRVTIQLISENTRKLVLSEVSAKELTAPTQL